MKTITAKNEEPKQTDIESIIEEDYLFIEELNNVVPGLYVSQRQVLSRFIKKLLSDLEQSTREKMVEEIRDKIHQKLKQGEYDEDILDWVYSDDLLTNHNK